MKIEILGTGCAKCKKLEKLVQQVVAETGATTDVVKVEKIEDIMKHGVAFTPALVVDGAVKAAGGLPKAAQIKAWLEQAATER